MIDGYKELIAEIGIHTYLKESAEESLKYYQKVAERWTPKELGAMNYSGMPKGSSLDLDPGIVFTKAIIYANKVKEEEEMLDKLKTKKALIDKAINETNINVKVGMLRAMGLTQEQVGELIGYSDRQVRNIEKKIREVSS
jgi:hypothetical protein